MAQAVVAVFAVLTVPTYIGLTQCGRPTMGQPNGDDTAGVFRSVGERI